MDIYQTVLIQAHVPDSDGGDDDDILGHDDKNVRMKGVYFVKVQPV